LFEYNHSLELLSTLFMRPTGSNAAYKKDLATVKSSIKKHMPVNTTDEYVSIMRKTSEEIFWLTSPMVQSPTYTKYLTIPVRLLY
jgi:hypothetical protein